MSLLLEALKKAERAKQEQSGKVASRHGLGEHGSGGPGMEPAGAVRTPAKSAQKEPLELSLVDHPVSESRFTSPGPSGSVGAQQAAERAIAERQAAAGVFAAKKSTRRPLPVLAIAVAAGVIVAAGGGFYVWTETSRPGIAVNPGGNVVASRAAAPATAAPAPGIASQTQAPSRAASAGLPLPPEKATPNESENASERKTAEAKSEVPPARSPVAAPDSTPAIKIRRTRPVSAVNPTLESAYQAFVAGDTGAAQQGYQRVLQTEPNNRDALLGLATIALKQGQEAEAERYYLRVLELDPRDPVANAGIIDLKQIDPVLSETRLKMLLAQQPEAGYLHFALGNQYAVQSRWAEAQRAYFKALSAEPANADFAFNLAVSLDHLTQRKLALDYYRRALTLAANAPAAFDRAQASSRIRELEQQ